ncbi:hypothetical protein TPHA_0E00550 [Tetrapisispora phaffii CBS 4417]|uniref:PUM-HD domain-containing protein n=1 Tax=Tetrapisispora phaffii (strain ATCC 24235 / CBS 4417 / NBRC 1672 / NRRL Y-8282 / UCD 70-5) TaxID=1071381 RepID=G8BTC2_TETPH|nr:hypothetical protein TPHA_0E00550 [Tetrapisispora phaffii CBS 4417]CCE63150.1 hypothetical protein TPHA_0E00550 [Tetrapisispora phaffii CBS 4417]
MSSTSLENTDGDNVAADSNVNRNQDIQTIDFNVLSTPKRKTSMPMNSASSTPLIILPSIEGENEVNVIHGNDPDSLHPQKIGSYRIRAGNKISNTLSNLLPSSLSAKLHHSKKLPNDTTTPDGTGNNNGNKKFTKPITPQSIKKDERSPVTEKIEEHNELNVFSNIHDSTSLLLSATTSNTNNNVHNARRRTDTMNSQITNLSMSAGPASSTIWAPNNAKENMQTNNENLTQQHLSHPYLHNNLYSSSLQTFTSDVTNSLQNNNRDNLMIPQPFPTTNSSVQDNNNNNTWSSNNNITTSQMNNSQNTDFFGNRQRSKSTATNIYPDNVLYEQKNSRNRTFTISGSTGTPAFPVQNMYMNGDNAINNTNNVMNSGMYNEIVDIPLVDDDVDPTSLNWVTTDTTAPYINQVSNLLPSDTISISNIFSMQQQNSQLYNVINLTSTALVTLCSRFGKVNSARTLQNLNIALVKFDSVNSAVLATEMLQNKAISMVGVPCHVAFAKIFPTPVPDPNRMTNMQFNNENGRSLLQEQLFNGNFSLQQQGNITVPVFNQQFIQLQHQMQQIQKQQTQSNSQHHNQQNSSLSNNQQHASHQSTTHITNADKEQCPFHLPPETISSQQDSLKDIINSFDTKVNKLIINHVVNNALKDEGKTDISNFGPLPKSNPSKEFDAPTLRELRKIIDGNQMSDLEIEQLALVMLDELPELSSDYLGNTIVQKLFDHSSDIIKDIMLRKTAKYLTTMGVHKNGTWACQKMIKKATTSRQKMLIAEGVKKYCTPLFNDQFGNYVIQCVLKFGFPWNNFIFESIIANFWTIAQNRYGSRAVRACLEAHNIITEEQTIVLSAIIVLYVQYLITNGNGTLLVTWFLDTCNLPNRHEIFAKRLVPNIVELSCHKLSSLTILKILTFRGDDTTRNIILSTIFGPIPSDKEGEREQRVDKDKDESSGPPEALIKILNDKSNGPTFIYKVLSMPLLEDDIRAHVVKQVRKVLLDSSSSAQNHRRLMEEVGLASLSPQSPNSQNNQQRNSNGNNYANAVQGNDITRHVSHVSVSSVRSNGAQNINQGAALNKPALTKNMQLNQPIMNNSYPTSGYPGLSPTPLLTMNNNNTNNNPNLNGNTNHGYYNYPSLYSMNSNTSSNFPYNDDLTSQIESLMINNNENQNSILLNGGNVQKYGI